MMQNVFTKTLERITKETGLVGGVAIVFKNGEITFAAPYGYEDRENNIPMTLNASFDIASCSKAWTVMLAAQAVDEGLMRARILAYAIWQATEAACRAMISCATRWAKAAATLCSNAPILTRARASGKRINTITICILYLAILWRCCAVAKAGKAR